MSNTQPTSVSLDTPLVRSRAGGQLVGTLSGDDPQGDLLTFSVTDTRFVVVGDQLFTSELFDLGNAPPSSLDLAITATDPGGLFLTTTISLTVAPSGLLRDVVRGGGAAATGDIAMTPASFPAAAGSAVVDSVSYAGNAIGAAGVAGGAGASGGGVGGMGGVGGTGTAGAGVSSRIEGLTFNLRQAGTDSLALQATAQGGQGGEGGTGGDGADGAPGVDWSGYYDTDLNELFTIEMPTAGSDGGDGGDGGMGGDGGGATASILNTSITMGGGVVTLKAQANGGHAGDGGWGGLGGLGGDGGMGYLSVLDAPSGSDGVTGLDGDQGDYGGDATASVSFATIGATGSLDLRLEAIAVAGTGWFSDGDATASVSSNIVRTLQSGSLADTVAIVVQASGDSFGSDARIAGNDIHLGDGNDTLSLSLSTNGSFFVGSNIFNGGTGTDTFDASAIGDRDVVIDLRNSKFGVPGTLVNQLRAFEGAVGGAGDDTLLAGSTGSTLEGGNGADTFILHRNARAHAIVDFNPAEGDTVQLANFGWLLDTMAEFDAAVSDTPVGAVLSFLWGGQPGSILFADVTEADLLAAYKAGDIRLAASYDPWAVV